MWMSIVPPVEGRYWWRAPDKYGRPHQPAYGLILVQWAKSWDDSMPPKMSVTAHVIFNSSHHGELYEGQGWSYGAGGSPADFVKAHPGIQFWSEPERGPGGFLPDLPGKPAWVPPPPEEVKRIAAERKKSAEAVAQREVLEANERTARIDEALKLGETLFLCDGCDELYDEDDLVQVRECPHCNEKFNGTENGQNCPTCNRRFTRNITEHGCPDCLDEECEPLPETVRQPEAAPVTKTKRRK